MSGGLVLRGPCGWWGEAVRTGTWAPPDGVVLPVVALLGPELGSDEQLERARERAGPWVRRRDPGTVPLLGVEAAEGRSAWLYEPCAGVSLGLVLAAPAEPFPLRVAAEIVAAAADVLDPLGPAAQLHPGPEPDHVLLQAEGTVRIAGFVGPFAPSPAYREPRGSDDDPAVVWRLGVLLAQILTRIPPPPATDRSAHEAMFRRVLVRVLSRPGPTFPERYKDWLSGMLAWDGVDRPVLRRVASGLRELADTLPGPTFAEWARAHVPELRARGEEGDPFRLPEPPLDTSGSIEVRSGLTGDFTQEVGPGETSSSEPEPDEITAVSQDGSTPAKKRRGMRERGTIPVGVGPPPEALARNPRLPGELFSQDARHDPVPARVLGLDPLAVRALAVFTVVLLVIAAVASVYLFG